MELATVTAEPTKLRATKVASDDRIGVDRANRRINGYVVCEQGPCKSKGRGEFDVEALQSIVRLGNEQTKGVKVHFQHESYSDDGLGKHVARAKNFRLDERDGRKIVRADAHLTETAMKHNATGGKTPLGVFLLDAADEDPGSFQSSVVISTDKLEREDDEQGNRRPPLFRPTKLWASDFVDEGDAVHGDLFGVESLGTFMAGSDRRVSSKLAVVLDQYVDKLFPDAPAEVLSARIDGLRDRILESRFGPKKPNPKPEIDSVTTTTTETASSQQETSAVDALSSKIDHLTEQLAAKDTAEKAEKTRTNTIAALGKLAGLDVTEELAGELSVDDAIQSLAKRKQESHVSLGHDDGAGGKKLTAKETLGKEFEERKELLQAAGWSKADWVSFTASERGIDLGGDSDE
ncbi:hypothetical protein Enr13x_07220 [Stieleria neptunia]|uniref:Uncharacterized protein n=1 Tax=Stieleria neptunia TaxID=2527979 RepID=A0A518HJ60_9BACT|nr:hypothetical protein [Stieleria neptunia]QDV40886.1 hypothetical protein Enr13x_07220 [Stieleria neptunia]